MTSNPDSFNKNDENHSESISTEVLEDKTLTLEKMNPFATLFINEEYEHSIDYWHGFEDGKSSMLLELYREKEKQTMYHKEYESIIKLMDSYIQKAQIQLQLAKGETFCDVEYIKQEINDLRSSICVLREMVNDMVVLQQQMYQHVLGC